MASSLRAITVTGEHHWQRGTLLLEVAADERVHRWSITPPSVPDAVHEMVVDQDSDVAIALERLFMWLGAGPETMRVAGASVADVYRLVYAMAFPGDVRFVRASTCGCNMGHCEEVTAVKITEHAIGTYGAAMATLGIRALCKPTDVAYFEYPDSVWLYLAWMAPGDSFDDVGGGQHVHGDHTGRGKPITLPHGDQHAAPLRYLRWMYSR